jgi:polyferredoxin
LAPGRWVLPSAAFTLTFALLAIVQVIVERPMLLAERYRTGAGWLEIPILAGWAFFLVTRMLEPTAAPRWRGRLWALFSAVFFGQLLLGMLGMERMLMTGTLHLPIPALIIGGPLYRGEGFFMPILLTITLLLAGSAWCSHLCYIGAWDNTCSRLRRRAAPEIARLGGGRRRLLRWGTLLLVTLAALLLGRSGLPAAWAIAAAALFGVLGVAVMLVWSSRTGVMAHCAWYCPIGIVTTRLGRLNPFRIRVTDRCTRCGACSAACRYDALTVADVQSGRPDASCTLCGDCLAACRYDSLEYRFPGLGPEGARGLFLVLVVSLHALFLGVARI